MNWKNIEVSEDWTFFLYQGQRLFDHSFRSVLKFKAPGMAPVEDDKGWYFIDPQGQEVITERFRFQKAWGFYEGLCSVEDSSGYFHLLPTGEPAYTNRFAWCGNFQEGRCSVREVNGVYYHILPDGKRAYQEDYQYVGDFKDGRACAMLLERPRFKHIDRDGQYFYDAEFHDLGIYHKGIATAKNERGWFHIDLEGMALYADRYGMVEPFYNGVAFCESLNGEKVWVSLSRVLGHD